MQSKSFIVVSNVVKRNSIGTLDQILSADYADSGNANTRVYQFRVGDAEKLQFVLFSESSLVGVTGATTISSGTWYHVAGTWDGTTVTLYVNGVSDGSVSFSGTLRSGGTNSVILGASQSGGGGAFNDFFDGSLDEVSLWSRALSSTEVAQLYNSGSGIQHPFITAGAPGKETYAGYTIDDTYTYSTSTQNILPAISYPYASSTATSTLNLLTTATTTSYTVYTPFSGYQDASSTVTTFFTLNGKLVGAYTYQKGNEASTGKVSYVLVNYLGTPALSTDEHGDIVEMDITDVFGNYVHRDQRNDNALHAKSYTGHEYDDVSGLLYAKARYLDTRAHTFLSVDPMLYKIPQSYLLDPQQRGQ